jgi:hypothetical protein
MYNCESSELKTNNLVRDLVVLADGGKPSSGLDQVDVFSGVLLPKYARTKHVDITYHFVREDLLRCRRNRTIHLAHGLLLEILCRSS